MNETNFESTLPPAVEKALFERIHRIEDDLYRMNSFCPKHGSMDKMMKGIEEEAEKHLDQIKTFLRKHKTEK